MIGAFVERYNHGWLLQRHGYMTPARSTCPENPDRYTRWQPVPRSGLKGRSG